MATRKTGTVTGASLEKSIKGKKGGLTGSKRVTGESSTLPSTPTDTSTDTPQPITSLGIPTPPSIAEKLKASAETVANIVEKGSNTISAIQGYTSRITESIKGTDNDRNPSGITNGQVNTADILQHASAEIDPNVDSHLAPRKIDGFLSLGIKLEALYLARKANKNYVALLCIFFACTDFYPEVQDLSRAIR